MLAMLVPKRSEVSKDGSKKQSKRANIMKTSDFESMSFDMFHKTIGTPGLPRKPQDSQEASQDGSKQPPTPSPKMAPKVVQKSVATFRRARRWYSTSALSSSLSSVFQICQSSFVNFQAQGESRTTPQKPRPSCHCHITENPVDVLFMFDPFVSPLFVSFLDKFLDQFWSQNGVKKQ